MHGSCSGNQLSRESRQPQRVSLLCELCGYLCDLSGQKLLTAKAAKILAKFANKIPRRAAHNYFVVAGVMAEDFG